MIGEVTRVLDTWWDRFLAIEPRFATAVGDSRLNDVLPDPAEDGRAARQRVHASLLAAIATDRGCCSAWSRSSSPAAPPRGAPPTSDGWRRSPLRPG